MSVFFSSKCSLFHNSNLFGSCFIHILCTGCAKIKKNNSGAKRLKHSVIYCVILIWCCGSMSCVVCGSYGVQLREAVGVLVVPYSVRYKDKEVSVELP